MPECGLQGKRQTSVSCVPYHREGNTSLAVPHLILKESVLHLGALLQPTHWVLRTILVPSGTAGGPDFSSHTHTRSWNHAIWRTQEVGDVSDGIRLQVNH